MSGIKNFIFNDKRFLKSGNPESEKDGIILTTRSRIARNLNGFRFNTANSMPEKKEILESIRNSFFSSEKSKNYIYYNISKLSRLQRRFFVERHILSPEMIFRLYAKGLILKLDHRNFNVSVSIMINEEDHLRIQSTMPGLNICRTFKEIAEVEKILEKKLSFSFDRDFGYLNNCPTNLGTALRVSVIAHLPGIVVTGKVEDFVKKLGSIGCSIRGFYGEGSEIVGNIFQISNQVSLGKNEKQITEEMNAICLNIIEEESDVIKSLKDSRPAGVEDGIMRSYGMLKYAKMLSYGEALEILSMIKLGRDTCTLHDIKPFNFYQLISLLGESNIILGKNISADSRIDEVDMMRAGIVRNETLKGNKKRIG
ncbi:MAG: hypothetical protein FJW66_03300 [Actinobacteria bacterium]|nr:hypothetical protein [Actinomycetota bacterium]